MRLREGLRTASGAALDARDAVASIARARARGAAALLADIPTPRPRRAATRSRSNFPAPSIPTRLARALASPLCALSPGASRRAAPDGTGAFRAELSTSGARLTRNPNAARGPSFLDAIDVARADDLKVSLRSFEAERDDIGWLGTGLFDGRKGAVKFDLGVAAWVVLTTGPDAGELRHRRASRSASLDAVPADRLAHLGLGALAGTRRAIRVGAARRAISLVDEDAAHLVEIARALAPILSRPGHEVTAAPVPRAEIGTAPREGESDARRWRSCARSARPRSSR